MKKILFSMLLLFSLGMADSVLLMKKGWQLVGSSVAIDTMSRFGAEDVEEIWHFDAGSQQWLGYSPDAQIQKKMSDKGIAKLTTLKNWHGFWIKSKKEWTLILESKNLSTVPSDDAKANDFIELKKGWNLISLPIDMVLSADIFKEMVVWKYNPSQEWEFFDESQSESAFSKLGHIKNSDGLWVKAEADQTISVIQEAAKLHNFKTTVEMESFLTELVAMSNQPYSGIVPLMMPTFETQVGSQVEGMPEVSADTTTVAPAPTESTATTDEASGTNLQESGVDESDIVKHDGETIYYIGSNQGNFINVTTFDALTQGNTKALRQITFGDNRNIDALYLSDQRLIVLSRIYSAVTSPNEGSEAESTGVATDLYYPGYGNQQILVDIFDVSDSTVSHSLASYTIDGDMVDSRIVAGKLYLISRFTPQIDISYPKVFQPLSESCKSYFDGSLNYNNYSMQSYALCYDLHRDEASNQYYRYNYENPTIKIIDLIPDIEGSGMAKETLIKAPRLYASSKQKQNATLTTLSSFTLFSGAYEQSNSFVGESSIQYASLSALYLVSNEYPFYYDFDNYKIRSSIYKFNLDATLSYRGMGSVDGQAINQFALSEYSDILRIATTEGFSWGTNGTNNRLYTLKEQNGLLPIQGILSGLGKEGETIKAVRFMGEKGYVVTFRQTDPLYTIDLSDPLQPTKMGELQIDGYAAYLHPIGEDRLLGIGRDADSQGVLSGVKIELFDISDFANPYSLDSIVLASDTSSELEFNHKALAYRASDNLFAFPYQSYGSYLNNYQVSSYLGLYQVKDDQLLSYQAIAGLGGGWGNHRGVIFDRNGTTYVSFFADGFITTNTLGGK